MAKSKPTLNLVSQTAASYSTEPSSSASNRLGRYSEHPVSKVRISYEKVQGNLPLEVQIKMTQRRVLKCGCQMQKRTTVRGNSLLQERTRFSVFKNVQGNFIVDDDSKWPHNYQRSRAYVPHLEKVYSNLRQQLNRKPEDKMEDLDANTLIWRMFMTVTQQATVHLGNDYLEILHSTKILTQRTVKQFFDVTKKLNKDQKEIQGISVIDWLHSSWKRTTLLTDRQFGYQQQKPTYSPTQHHAWAPGADGVRVEEISQDSLHCGISPRSRT